MAVWGGTSWLRLSVLSESCLLLRSAAARHPLLFASISDSGDGSLMDECLCLPPRVRLSASGGLPFSTPPLGSSLFPFFFGGGFFFFIRGELGLCLREGGWGV